MPKEVSLTRGKVAIVDDEDYRWLIEFNWQATPKNHTWYASRWVYARRTSLSMHRAILGAPPHYQIDHRNGNGLDNRRSNLRAATTSQNQMNSVKHRVWTTSKYKGVHWVNNRGKWQVQLSANKKRHFGGWFDDEIEAALAYDRLARKYCGEFARLNFPLASELPALLEK